MFRIYKWKNCSCKQVHRYFTQNNVQTKPTHRHYVKLTVATIAVTSPILYYYTLDSIGKRKWKVTIGGIYRFVRSLKIGLSISFDYKWTLYGLDELASEYESMCSILCDYVYYIRSADHYRKWEMQPC